MHKLLIQLQDIVLTGFLLLNIACHNIKGVTCPNDVDGIKTFGFACEYLCHCVNRTEQCDDVSGSCTSGCRFDWLGRGCQYRNIARTSILTTHLDNVAILWATRAIDMDVNTCSETATANSTTANKRTEPPWWLIWWKKKELFRVIVISTKREMLGYFSNFSVYFEENPYSYNRTYYTRREICHEHDGASILTTTMTVTCRQPLSGNQVRIQLASTQTQLVLCDVRMFGECNDYECGIDCSIPCHCAVATFNNNVTGHCLEGCAAGWTGQGKSCDEECDNGTYGFNCSGHCHCEDNAVCDKVYGQCPGECAAGWMGDTCDTVCNNGTYGLNCSGYCSGHCKDNAVCDNVYGHCPQGCSAGWMGDTCDIECTYGTFGKNCTVNCSDHCEGNVTCNHVNGFCVDGCEPGWTGSQCVSVVEAYTTADHQISLVIPVVGSVAGFILAAGLILGIILYKRRHDGYMAQIYEQLMKRLSQGQINESTYDNLQDLGIQREVVTENEQTYENQV